MANKAFKSCKQIPFRVKYPNGVKWTYGPYETPKLTTEPGIKSDSANRLFIDNNKNMWILGS